MMRYIFLFWASILLSSILIASAPLLPGRMFDIGVDLEKSEIPRGIDLYKDDKGLYMKNVSADNVQFTSNVIENEEGGVTKIMLSNGLDAKLSPNSLLNLVDNSNTLYIFVNNNVKITGTDQPDYFSDSPPEAQFIGIPLKVDGKDQIIKLWTTFSWNFDYKYSTYKRNWVSIKNTIYKVLYAEDK